MENTRNDSVENVYFETLQNRYLRQEWEEKPIGEKGWWYLSSVAAAVSTGVSAAAAAVYTGVAAAGTGINNARIKPDYREIAAGGTDESLAVSVMITDADDGFVVVEDLDSVVL